MTPDLQTKILSDIIYMCDADGRCGADGTGRHGPRGTGSLPAGGPGQGHDGPDGGSVGYHLRHGAAYRCQRQSTTVPPQSVPPLISTSHLQVMLRCQLNQFASSIESYQFSIPESEAVTAVVARVRAVDLDVGANAEMEYRILDGDGLGIFSISTDTKTQEGLVTLDQVSSCGVLSVSYDV